MVNKNLIKHTETRIKEEEKIMKELFNIDIFKLNNQQLSNIITRCNWTIALRLELGEENGK